MVDLFALSDVGRTRDHNEDAYVVADLSNSTPLHFEQVVRQAVGPAGHLYMVADGMGGAAAGELASEVDPTQMAFEVNALELGANWAFQLYGDKQAFARAREAILESLHRQATAQGSAMLPVIKKIRSRARS